MICAIPKSNFCPAVHTRPDNRPDTSSCVLPDFSQTLLLFLSASVTMATGMCPALLLWGTPLLSTPQSWHTISSNKSVCVAVAHFTPILSKHTKHLIAPPVKLIQLWLLLLFYLMDEPLYACCRKYATNHFGSKITCI